MENYNLCASYLALLVVFLLYPGSATSQIQDYDTSDLDPQLKLAREIPGFGGFYIDDYGTPTVFLRLKDQKGVATKVLAPTIRSLNLSPEDLQVREGRFDYVDLARWSNTAIRELVGMEDLVMIDVDEGKNTLYFAIRPGSDAGEFAKRIRGLGFPDNAYTIAEEEPLVADTFLFDQIRPVPGGVGIVKNPNVGTCTLGFNVALAVKGNTRDHRRSFVTNSHCTNVQGGEEGTVIGQPSGSNDIGTEIDDPDYLVPGLFQIRFRYSDSSRFLYNSRTGYSLAAIARPIAPNPGPGTTPSLPNNKLRTNGVFRIIGERSNPIKGLTVHKVGRATGWTTGKIDRTCALIGYTNNGRVYRFICQAIATYGRSGGDSGSPVFEIVDQELSGEPNTGHHVRLNGIHWGGSGDAPPFRAAYSPLANIERELGKLTVFTDTPGDMPVLPDLVPFPLVNLPGTQGFCNIDTSANRLKVRVINQHDVAVPVETTTRVLFHEGTTLAAQSATTPPLQPFEFADLTFNKVPQSCIVGSCSFTIAVDADLEVQETFGDEVDEHEINNIVTGQCIHID